MASNFRQVPSPAPSEADSKDLGTPAGKVESSRTDMLRIGAILNPSGLVSPDAGSVKDSASPPPTPASTPTSSYFTGSRSATPTTASSTKGKKQVKSTLHGAIKAVRGNVNYPPHELTELATCLSLIDQQELSRQHKLFQVLPYSENEQDLIASFTRHIPYSSDKKTFGGKTGRDGFDVFQYFFRVPSESAKFTVMWDYDNGLVRITPFFKACNYTKTTPAKALNTNAGLKDLAHSITGGALDAQGYWMPYSCARAMCKTFCYDIRWALTPIFGPNFIHECIEKDDLRFGRFKIDIQIVRAAQEEANACKTPSVNSAAKDKTTPRSVPEHAQIASGKDLPPRAARPTFKVDSPFSSDSEATYTLAPDSPAISPKSTFSSPAWTSINTRPELPTTSTGSGHSLQHSLLNEPRYASWRPAETYYPPAEGPKPTGTIVLGGGGPEDKSNKRRRMSTRKTQTDTAFPVSRAAYDDEASHSESDDEDLVIPSSPKKRVRHARKGPTSAPSSRTLLQAKDQSGSRKYRADEYRAANWLLSLSMRDADLATGPNGPVQLKE